ncbi:hypothetical protein ACS0TY_006458 [Phlomoides rotata]
MALVDDVHPPTTSNNYGDENATDGVTSPILVDRAITPAAAAAAAASIISDEEASCRFEYPEKAIASEGLKHQIIVKLGIWIRMIARMCMLLMILPQRILKTNQMVAIHRMLAHALAIKPNHWSALEVMRPY